MAAVRDVNGREVAIGDEIELDGAWHPVVGIEHGLRLRSKEGVSILGVAILANGGSWNVATRQTRKKGG
jgi:hypothetical protein